ncbi:MAG: hypothetical protein K2Q18_09925, partial [Bdellovibrionales bacterium]|nr:hypothetical protein [Bdellovibrionales bacterium]
MINSYQWRVVLKNEFKIKSDEHFIYILYRGRKQQLSKTLELSLILKEIRTFKLFIKINENISPV